MLCNACICNFLFCQKNLKLLSSLLLLSTPCLSLYLSSLLYCHAGVCAFHPPIRLPGDPAHPGALHSGADPAHPGGATPALWAAGPGKRLYSSPRLCSWAPVQQVSLAGQRGILDRILELFILLFILLVAPIPKQACAAPRLHVCIFFLLCSLFIVGFVVYVCGR